MLGVQQGGYATQLDPHADTPGPPSGPAQQDTSEPTTQSKRSRFSSRNGVAPDASHIARSVSVPTRLSFTNDAAQPLAARASSLVAVPEHPRRPTNAPGGSEGAPRQEPSSKPENTSQRITELDASQPVREPDIASLRTGGPGMTREHASTEAAAGPHIIEPAPRSERTSHEARQHDYGEISPQDVRDAGMGRRSTLEVAEAQQRQRGTGASQQGGAARIALPTGEMPASAARDRHRVPARALRATGPSPQMPSTNGR